MTHDERVYHHMYETNEGIAEHAERIAALEELVLEMYGAIEMTDYVYEFNDPVHLMFADRMQELGMEVSA